jgi:hypothetical protein
VRLCLLDSALEVLLNKVDPLVGLIQILGFEHLIQLAVNKIRDIIDVVEQSSPRVLVQLAWTFNLADYVTFINKS